VTENLKFAYDGWQCIAELNATNNALVRSYVWGTDLSGSTTGAGGVGGLLMLRSEANGMHFYAYDGNGNVAGLVKATDGTMSANYEYGPFGEVIRATGSSANENRFQFSTKRCDATTDFLLYEYRLLRTDIGKWLSRDPIGERGELNLYVFVGNNAAAKYDKLGLCGCGPDVTDALVRTMLSVQRQWELASEEDRKITCEKIDTRNGWDATIASSKTLPSACGVSANCAMTVTVNGVCYYGPEVNYVLYGKISALCGVSQPVMSSIISGWKLVLKPGPYDGQLRGALAWANAGHVGWPHSKPPYSDRQNCKPCTTVHPALFFNWHAGKLTGKSDR